VGAKPFRILSLDGGGIRGAFIAGFLAGLEDHFGAGIGSYFDLIAGTSTGAIIAAAVATGIPADRIESFYCERGPIIFTRRPKGRLSRLVFGIPRWIVNLALRKTGLDCDQFFYPRYESEGLRNALVEVFGEKTLAESVTRLIIPAVDLTRGQTIVFKTPHLPGLVRDRHYKLVDVLLATAAAPLYFPHAVIARGSAYVDGGLWANNPSMVAVAEAHRIGSEARRPGVDFPISHDDIHLLSIGTGMAPYFDIPCEKSGLSFWASRLIGVTGSAQSQGITFQSQYVLGSRSHRIDFELPRDGAWTLDNVKYIHEMIHRGRERANERYAQLRDAFFSRSADHQFTSFPDSPGRVSATLLAQ
jgi:hypothetical protein